MTLKRALASRIQEDLENIERELKHNLNPHLDLVRETAGHLIFSGGKRIRPLLNVLSSRLCGYADPFIHKFSTVIEFLHTATLLHDDVIDGASIRRGKPVAHSISGAPVAILVGDFLLARSLGIASETRNPYIISVIANLAEHICEGEIQQLTRKGDISLTEAEYMDIITRKTGLLIQGACQTGAVLAGAERHTEERLARFGFHVGLAFQIADDLLDYTADSAAFGKTVGADLKEGKLTLPVIYALSRANAKDRARMEKIIVSKDFDDAKFSTLTRLLREYGGIEYSRQIARTHVEQAKDIMGVFSDSETRSTLMMIADYTLQRTT